MRVSAIVVSVARSWFIGILVAVVAGLLLTSGLWIWLSVKRNDDTASLSPVACDDHNACTKDYRYSDGTCLHRPFDINKVCSDACYTGGHCNGNGACMGGVCLGTCDAEFDATLTACDA